MAVAGGTVDFWTPEQIQILQETPNLKENIVTLQSIIGKNSRAIFSKAKRLGLIHNSRRSRHIWTGEEVQKIRDHSCNYTAADLQKELFSYLTYDQIQDKILELGAEKKKWKLYEYDRDFFKTPNLLNCYWAGFSAADACVSIQKNTHYFKLKLASRDIDHIKTFKEDVQYTGDIYSRRDYGGKAHCGYSDNSTIRISGIQNDWSIDLSNNFNITPRKSLIIQAPTHLKDELALAFIKGYIDGDGHLTYTANHEKLELNCGACGTESMMDWILDICKTKLQIPTETKNRKVGNIWYFYIRGSNCSILLSALNDIIDRGLPRKWNMYKNKYMIDLFNDLDYEYRKINIKEEIQRIRIESQNVTN